MALKEKVCSNCNSLIEYPHKGKPELCPNCNAKYWDKPVDERDLFLLQDIYIEGGRKRDDLTGMYVKLLQYSKNIIKHKLRNKKILDQEEFDMKANDIAIIMIERYLKKDTEISNHSFGGMMMWVANGVLYGSKKDDQVESLNQTYLDSSKELINNIYNLSSSEHEEMNSKDPQRRIHLISKDSLLIEISSLIDTIYSKVRKKKSPSNLLYLLGVNHFFNQKKEFFIRDFNHLISTKTKRDIENTKLVIRKYLKDQSTV